MSTKALPSPFGEALYPYLNRPDTRFGEKYKVTLVLNPNNPEHARYLDLLKSIALKEVGKDAHLPISEHDDGRVKVRFASKFQPKLFDRSNKPLEGEIGTGSILQISAIPKVYKDVGGRSGLTLYPVGIKVRDLVEPWGTPEAFGFDPAESDESEVDHQAGAELPVEESTPFEEELSVFGEATEKLPF